MCGITGFLRSGNTGPREPLVGTVERMNRVLSHRGPDASGTWVDDEAGIAFGFSRLAIIDLSPAGHQPMISRTGRYVIAFNGEIYNYNDIRARLERDGQVNWRGHSDTEVLLEALDRWGFESTIDSLNGMFAFAAWDRTTRELHLCRDRLGEKPLYYGWRGDSFLFGSELKALRQYPTWFGEVNREALASYMRHGYVPDGYSIYSGISKLRPGEHLTLAQNGGRQRAPKLRVYWSAADAFERGEQTPFRGDGTEAATALESLLRDAVKIRMNADVPVGAFLSGGIDSSAIVALMQLECPGRVRTFSIGNAEAEYDEAHHARAVAAHLGTDHTEMYVTPEDALEVIPRLPHIYDEPFADSSQIPTTLLSALTRRHVTVSLSGDGGDELFGGYNRYFWGSNIWQAIRWLPRPTRLALAAAIRGVRPSSWQRVLSAINPLLPAELRVRGAGDKAHKLASILGVPSRAALYRRLVTNWEPSSVVIGGDKELATQLNDAESLLAGDFVRQMMYLDMVTYLPGDILVKVDRASMAASLEARVPFLDHRVVEFAATLPTRLNVQGNTGKRVLREMLYRHVPRALIERPKMGFGVPIDSWLRGPLRGWAEALLDAGKLRQQGLFNEQAITSRWREHTAGTRNNSYLLWNVLMFQAWADANSVE